MLTTKKLLLASAASALLPFTVQAAGVFDDFTTAQGAIECTPNTSPSLCVDGDDGPNSASSFVNGGMLTGQRDVLISSPVLPSSSSNRGNVIIENGLFTWNNETDAETTVVVQYDGDDSGGASADTAVFDGAAAWDVLTADMIVDDLTFGGTADSFLVNVLQNDGAFQFTLTVTDGAGNVSTLSEMSESEVGIVSLAYSDFSGSADFTMVDNLEFELVAQAGSLGSIDFRFDSLAANVPEPASLALMVTGLLGLGAARRRKALK